MEEFIRQQVIEPRRDCDDDVVVEFPADKNAQVAVEGAIVGHNAFNPAQFLRWCNIVVKYGRLLRIGRQGKLPEESRDRHPYERLLQFRGRLPVPRSRCR